MLTFSTSCPNWFDDVQYVEIANEDREAVPKQNPNNKVLIVEDNVQMACSLAQMIDYFKIHAEVADDSDEAARSAKGLAKLNLAPYYQSQCVPVHR